MPGLHGLSSVLQGKAGKCLTASFRASPALRLLDLITINNGQQWWIFQALRVPEGELGWETLRNGVLGINENFRGKNPNSISSLSCLFLAAFSGSETGRVCLQMQSKAAS